MSEDYTDISGVETSDSMWPLRWFHYDEGIDSPEVYLLDGPGEAEFMSHDEALAIARSRGLHLVPEWPEHLTTGPAWCRIGMVSLPVRWEQLPEPEQAGEPDPLLWFEGSCGGRDLLAGNGGTFHSSATTCPSPRWARCRRRPGTGWRGFSLGTSPASLRRRTSTPISILAT